MKPIPQSPWTLAIAERLGMRAAAAGPDADPAELLAQILPGGEPPPEGWLERFLAGTPVPGLSPPASSAAASSPPVAPQPTAMQRMQQRFAEAWNRNLDAMARMGLEIPGRPPLPGSAPPGGSISRSSSSESSAALSGSFAASVSSPPASSAANTPAGWDTLRAMLPSASDADSASDSIELPPAGTSVVPITTGSASGSTSGSASGSMSAPGSLGGSPSSATSAGGVRSGSLGQEVRVQLVVQVDAPKLAEEMKAVARSVAERAINYHQFVRDRQIYASIRQY
jgi:hypothetical protein